MTHYQQSTTGAFVLGGFVLALCAIIFFGNVHLFSSQKKAIVIFPDSVSGLGVGSSVTFRGVRVGSVSSIKLRYDQEEHKAYIPVTITLDTKKIQIEPIYKDFNDFMEAMVKNGLCAEISTESFVTGSSNIYLNFNKKNIPVFHPKLTNELFEIPARPSAIQQIKSELMNLHLEKLSEHLDLTIQKIGELSDQLNQKLPPLIDSVQKTSERTQQLITTINQNINSVSTNLNTLLLNSNKQIQNRNRELHQILISTQQVIKHTSAVMQNMKNLTSKRSIERNNLTIILNNLASASSLRGFAKDIERNPNLLLMGRRK